MTAGNKCVGVFGEEGSGIVEDKGHNMERLWNV